MFINFLKIAFRNLARHKTFSLINIIGLAIGMTCFILIIQWVNDELSYDRHHKNADRICRVIWDIDGFQIPATPGPFADWLLEYIPEIKQATRVNHSGSLLQYKEKKITVVERFIEPRFFDVFSFQFAEGNSSTALNNTESILLTEETAKKLFGNENPVGKTITDGNGRPKIVTGVLRNIPRKTEPYLLADCFIPLNVMKFWRNPDSWEDGQDYKTYILLNENISLEEVNEKINSEFNKFAKKYNPQQAQISRMKFILQPITEVHLYSDFKFDFPHGNIQHVIFFCITGFFILMIACFNFMNLATARSLKRSKEVGLRKVVGANRLQLISQFLGESFIISGIALFLALSIVELVQPYFNSLTGKPLFIEYSNPTVIGGLILLLLITGLSSGMYPAFVLSLFKPVDILKNRVSPGVSNHSLGLRRILVVMQFTFSIIIIAGTVVVYIQLDFIKNKNLGFEKENLIYLESESFMTDYKSLKNELLKHPGIIQTAASSDLPTSINQNNGADWEGRVKDAKYISFPGLFVTDDFLETFQMEMAQGRFFSGEFATDKEQAFIVNEAAVKAMGIIDPVGKKFKSWGKDGQIIGVVKDFHFKSLHSEISPMTINLDDNFRFLFVRINSRNNLETIELVKNTYHSRYPDFLFEIHFFDEAIDELYQSDKKMGAIIVCFASLSIIISCLGLFGLVAFITECKTKEIGIRKVVGASVFNVIMLLTKDFTGWVLIANIIAWPVAYYFMNKWLEDFAYRIEITWWMFALSGGIALAIALVTVSFQAVKAALANPVESLKYE